MVQCSESSTDGTELQKGHAAPLLQKKHQNKSKMNPVLRVVIKLKPRQVEETRRGGKPEDICSPFPTGCPCPRCAVEATFRTRTPVQEGNFGYL